MRGAGVAGAGAANTPGSLGAMSAPRVTVVTEASPAARAGLSVGDELLSLNGRQPRDVIEYQQLVDAEELEIMVRRPGAELARSVRVRKEAGQPLGLEVSSAVFDRIRTCDNHCAFCFIYQLPKGMRKSLYLKDDDYRLSFLYGNFTTLTRFTELDAERVLSERLGPLFVSIHATDPAVRASMLRNPKSNPTISDRRNAPANPSSISARSRAPMSPASAVSTMARMSSISAGAF